MTDALRTRIDRLYNGEKLTEEEFCTLIAQRDEESAALLAERARQVRHRIFGKAVYIRGLIEISNRCKNDCYYCGIRASNRECVRYRLDEQTILACCAQGYRLGLRTFVLQGGEDNYYTDDRLCTLIEQIKAAYPDCALTLSLGERSKESYRRLKAAGADRYLLRHETADEAHYASLHPSSMSFSRRIECLHDLKSLGFQVGCGFMVGSPGQTERHLAKDLCFIQQFRPHMCGIGPFIPHPSTPFRDRPAGEVSLTCFLLSILRLIHPAMLIPSTTALSTLAKDGREQGILSGANVVMPNLSPPDLRKHYELYEKKAHSGAEAATGLEELKRRLAAIGYEISTDRGDYPDSPTTA